MDALVQGITTDSEARREFYTSFMAGAGEVVVPDELNVCWPEDVVFLGPGEDDVDLRGSGS